jgi:hypothetical protein
MFMKNYLYLFMLFGAMWAAQSCRKEPTKPIKPVVYGQVLEQGTNKPIPNAQIIVSHCVGDFGSSGGVSCINIDTFFTDSKGAYRYEPDYAIEDNGYTLTASAKGYLKQVDPAAIFANQIRKEDIVLVPGGYIKFHIKNISKSDWVQLLDWGQLHDNAFYGPNVDTTIYQLSYANKLIVFNWKVIKDITTTRFKDSIYLPALDAAFYRIEY